MELSNKFVVTGQLLGSINNFESDDGTYLQNGHIYSAICGKVTIE